MSISTIFVANTTSDAILSVTKDSVQVSSSSASSSASSTGTTAAQAIEIATLLSDKIAIDQLNIPNNATFQYNTTVTNTSATKQYCYRMDDCNCDCVNDCDIVYYENE